MTGTDFSHVKTAQTLTLQIRMGQHWGALNLRQTAHAAGMIAAAREFAGLRRAWEAENGGQIDRPAFLRVYVAAAVQAGEKSPSVGMQYKLWSAADAVDAGITVDADADDAWSALCAAGKRLETRMTERGETKREAADAVQLEVDQGVVRSRAARPADAPEGTVSVLLPDVARDPELRLHERLRTVAAAHRMSVPGGAPELRALLNESLSALPDDVLPAVLDGWKGWTAVRDEALHELMKRAGMIRGGG